MKNFFLCFLLTVYGCSAPESKKADDDNEKLSEETCIAIADSGLKYQTEKISLLSSISKVPFDTLYLILRDYHATILYQKYSSVNPRLIYQQSIESISKKHHISKSKLATLVFSFKYEMVSREDIEEDIIETLQENEQGEQESYDPDY